VRSVGGATGPVFAAADATLPLDWPIDQGGVVAVVDRAPRWLPAQTPDEEVLAVASWPRVTAVTAVRPGADRVKVGLAAAFAAHLADDRRDRPELGSVFITGADRPSPPAGWVRLPHVVTLATPEPVDELVWEILPRALARRWLGRPLPRRCFVEAQPAALLSLQRAARSGRLVDTPAGRMLAEALSGRYLSTRFVYDHTRLVARALRELTGAEAGGGRG